LINVKLFPYPVVTGSFGYWLEERKNKKKKTS